MNNLLTNKDLIKIIYTMGRDLWNLSLNDNQESKSLNNSMRKISRDDLVIEISLEAQNNIDNSVGFYISGNETKHKIRRLVDGKIIDWNNAIMVKIPIKLYFKSKSQD